MNLLLFTPANKIQKDRQITEAIDTRIAAFGRVTVLALIGGVSAYLLLVFVLDRDFPLAMTWLIGSLVPALVLQGSLLLRFGTLYLRGAARWRNLYLWSNLLTAAALATILAALPWFAGIGAGAWSLWLLAAVYVLGATCVYAPYQFYSRLLSTVVLVPPLLSLLPIPALETYAFVALYLVLYAVLMHQNRTLGDYFWQWQEARFLLQQKTDAAKALFQGEGSRLQLNNEFIANMGQELKTALNDILGGVVLLQDGSLTARQQELVAIAEKASERQLQLIDNIVDFAKISRQKLVLDNSVFSLRRELEDSFAELVEDAQQQNVELNYTISHELPYRAKGDASRIRQVIISLAANLIRFSEEGEVFIDVQAERMDEGRSQLLVNVYDEGESGDSGDQKALFDAFAKMKYSRAGTGLGLAICKGIAECMGGSVGMIVRRGRGKQFWFKVPLETKTSNSHYFVPNVKLRGKRLLLVDVPERVVQHLSQELDSWGLRVVASRGHRQALSLLAGALEEQDPYVACLRFTRLKDPDVWSQPRALAEDPRFHSLRQFVVAGKAQLQQGAQLLPTESYPQLTRIAKPFNYKLFHQLLVQRLLNVDLSGPRGHSFSEGMSSAHGKSCKILVVEDHRVNQLVAEGMLKKLGYRPKLANNGLEALEMFDREDFDLVLMDCQMAEMDGYMATQEIRSRETKGNRERHIPIIALTAHTADEDQSRCLAAGMDDYLPKPVRYNDLESRLRRWLGDSHSSRHHH